MSKRKGVALPINMLVILAVAVIVLLAVVAFFMTGFDTSPVDQQQIRNACCGEVVAAGYCGPGADEDAEWDDVEENLTVTIGEHEIECDEELTQGPVQLCC